MEGFLHQPLKIEEWVGILLLVAIVGSTVIAITAIVTDHLRRSRREEMDATLKMEMLAHGMSAEDVIKVLQARSRKQHGLADAVEGFAADQRHSHRQRRAMHEAMRHHTREA